MLEMGSIARLRCCRGLISCCTSIFTWSRRLAALQAMMIFATINCFCFYLPSYCFIKCAMNTLTTKDTNLEVLLNVISRPVMKLNFIISRLQEDAFILAILIGLDILNLS